MKAFVLAAGMGQRLRPLTETIPKPLLLVNNEPLITYHLRALAKVGVRDIIINLHYLSDQIRDALSDGSQFGVHISYSYEAEILGTAGCIVKMLGALGKDPFLVIAGDIWTHFPYDSLALARNHLAHLVLVPNPSFRPEGDFYLNDDGVLSDQPSQPNQPRYTYGSIGIYHPSFFAGLAPGYHDRGQLIHQHIPSGKITGEVYRGPWVNVGTSADLEEARQLAILEKAANSKDRIKTTP